jgi:hypothetical protein
MTEEEPAAFRDSRHDTPEPELEDADLSAPEDEPEEPVTVAEVEEEPISGHTWPPEPTPVGHLVVQDNVREPGVQHTHTPGEGNAEDVISSHPTGSTGVPYPTGLARPAP